MWVGVDIGGTKTTVCTAEDPSAALGAVRCAATPHSRHETVEDVVRLVRGCTAGAGVEGIGVSCGGPIDVPRGALLDRAGLGDVGVVDRLRAEFAAPVTLENDCNCGAWCEYLLGAGRDANTLLYVSISTGIGTGVVIGGAIHRGAHDTEGGCITIDQHGTPCPACGGRGHFESYASGLSIEREFGLPTSQIADPAVWDEIGRRIAVGLSSLMAALSPDRVVLAGGVVSQYERFGRSLQQSLHGLRQPYPPTPVMPARYVHTAPLRGALLLAARG